MRDRLFDLIAEMLPEDVPIDYLPDVDAIVDHLLAAGVIVPPCKVGSKVWFLSKRHYITMRKDTVYEAKVVRVYIKKNNILCLAIKIKNEWGNTEFPRITEIGKTVFLTKEEAEKALAEGSKDDG